MRQTDSAALLDIAERVRRLPAYNSRNPHAFYEGRDQLAAELRAIARAPSSAETPIAPATELTPHRPRRQVITSITVGGRAIMVQRRAAFAL
jgi:hypothetical protein